MATDDEKKNPYGHEAFFQQVLPGIEENVRNHDMIEPCIVVKLMDGRESIRPMGMLFQPGMKGAVVPVIEAVFRNEDVAMIALISECWFAQFSSKEELEKFEDKSLEGHERSVDGVMVSIYSRDRRDSVYSLKIKPGRTGVERQHDISLSNAEGRMVRDNPEDN